jgi:hypothetical protein
VEVITGECFALPLAACLHAQRASGGVASKVLEIAPPCLNGLKKVRRKPPVLQGSSACYFLNS